MKIKKIILLIITLIICMCFLSGCYSSANVETIAYAVAIRIR